MTTKETFKIGDTVWVAFSQNTTKHVQCPHCFGRKFLTVILGDDSQVTIDCLGCSAGYEPPRGYLEIYEWKENVVQKKISGIETSTARPTRYHFNESAYEYDENVFATESEAMARAGILSKKRNEEEMDRLNHKKHNENRTWSWNATYHRSELKRAKHDVEYHTAKLEVAKLHAKNKTDEISD